MTTGTLLPFLSFYPRQLGHRNCIFSSCLLLDNTLPWVINMGFQKAPFFVFLQSLCPLHCYPEAPSFFVDQSFLAMNLVFTPRHACNMHVHHVVSGTQSVGWTFRALSRNTCFTTMGSRLKENSALMMTNMEPKLSTEKMETQPAPSPEFLPYRAEDLGESSEELPGCFSLQVREETLTKKGRLLGVGNRSRNLDVFSPLSSWCVRETQ